MRAIIATELREGMRLALPFGRQATVSDVRVGYAYVNFRTEHGATRVGRHDEVLIETGEPVSVAREPGLTDRPAGRCSVEGCTRRAITWNNDQRVCEDHA